MRTPGNGSVTPTWWNSKRSYRSIAGWLPNPVDTVNRVASRAGEQLAEQLRGESATEERRIDRQPVDVDRVAVVAVAQHAGEDVVAAHAEEDQRLCLQLGQRLVQWRDRVVPDDPGLHRVCGALDLEHALGNGRVRVEHDAHVTCPAAA